MGFRNVYDDARRADAYAKLEFPGTYYLAYRDLPQIISKYVRGKKAIDFGCGTGRSTRFLQALGFETVGVDISDDMLRKARELDADGDYRLVGADDLGGLEADGYDVVLSAFTFDNIPTMERKVSIFREIRKLLKPEGLVVNLVSAPEIYINEWASFTTEEFPKNRLAKSGDEVEIIMTDVEDRRPVTDIVWSDAAYREAYEKADLELIETYKPLAKEDEPFEWVNESKIAPWVIYVLQKSAHK